MKYLGIRLTKITDDYCTLNVCSSLYANYISINQLKKQIKYLNFKVLALGIVNEEGEVFFPHRFIGFIPNLKEIF